jgi:hypothetical protein
MERHGGWLKRQLSKNRKRAIEALSNRLLVEEQIYQVTSMTGHPDTVLAWRSKALSLSRNWTTETADLDIHTHAHYKGRLLEKEKRGYAVSDSTYRALASHFETQAWTKERQRSNTLIRYNMADAKRLCLEMTSYRTFASATDYGRLSFRTKRSWREGGESRDCSWTKARAMDQAYQGGTVMRPSICSSNNSETRTSGSSCGTLSGRSIRGEAAFKSFSASSSTVSSHASLSYCLAATPPTGYHPWILETDLS